MNDRTLSITTPEGSDDLEIESTGTGIVIRSVAGSYVIGQTELDYPASLRLAEWVMAHAIAHGAVPVGKTEVVDG